MGIITILSIDFTNRFKLDHSFNYKRNLNVFSNYTSDFKLINHHLYVNHKTNYQNEATSPEILKYINDNQIKEFPIELNAPKNRFSTNVQAGSHKQLGSNQKISLTFTQSRSQFYIQLAKSVHQWITIVFNNGSLFLNQHNSNSHNNPYQYQLDKLPINKISNITLYVQPKSIKIYFPECYKLYLVHNGQSNSSYQLSSNLSIHLVSYTFDQVKPRTFNIKYLKYNYRNNKATVKRHTVNHHYQKLLELYLGSIKEAIHHAIHNIRLSSKSGNLIKRLLFIGITYAYIDLAKNKLYQMNGLTYKINNHQRVKKEKLINSILIINFAYKDHLIGSLMKVGQGTFNINKIPTIKTWKLGPNDLKPTINYDNQSHIIHVIPIHQSTPVINTNNSNTNLQPVKKLLSKLMPLPSTMLPAKIKPKRREVTAKPKYKLPQAIINYRPIAIKKHHPVPIKHHRQYHKIFIKNPLIIPTNSKSKRLKRGQIISIKQAKIIHRDVNNLIIFKIKLMDNQVIKTNSLHINLI